MVEDSKDPLEGFDFIDFDATTQRITIQIHPSILKNPKSVAALEKKCEQIINAGGVDKVDVVPRK